MAHTLSTSEMAEQLDITVPQLLRAVQRGDLPPPAIKTRPFRWVRRQLEDILAGKRPYAPESAVDPILERINGLDPDAIR